MPNFEVLKGANADCDSYCGEFGLGASSTFKKASSDLPVGPMKNLVSFSLP